MMATKAEIEEALRQQDRERRARAGQDTLGLVGGACLVALFLLPILFVILAVSGSE